ncbi:MAG: FAD-dependent oxidoreductase, partial [Chloroflexota bacterium]|nr:FAD-dependent oxidoreductase [Chloroflexota bacterium]
SLENRMRFLTEIIRSAQQKAGKDYVLMCRISGEEFMEGGMTLKETAPMAVAMERAGIQALDVQAGWHESPVPLVQMSVPRGAFVYVAEGIKKAVKIPVAAAYRISDPLLAEQILVEGKADLIGMGRALIADPDLPNKAREGNIEDIRTCIACNHCLDQIFEEKPVACAINAQTGHEAEYAIVPASKPKMVVVVGGGPAGLEAARVAALRGHRVTIMEQGEKLGGNLLVAAIPPHKEEIACFTSYLTAQVKKLGISVKLGTLVTAQAVLAQKPQAVIVAAGGSPLIPDIPGARGKNVVTAMDVLTGKAKTGQRVVMVGGGMVGCETAEVLAAQGKEITILEMLPRLGADIGASHRWVVTGRLRKANIKMEAGAKAEEITEKGVRATREGQSLFFEGDTVVLAVGMKANGGLAQELQGKVEELHVIGDCTQPRRITQAVEEGMKAGLAL